MSGGGKVRALLATLDAVVSKTWTVAVCVALYCGVYWLATGRHLFGRRRRP